eukprot:CAMPEP_0115539410 /NCGR_PEP_ID=MMETSP0271-20121206/89393_1 /TAXON_ID=71861 /ORGANISM="Scrippsiella trochoidea, Strain CCMP3099" /LENGTH=599 /DNA_ID=CAMNT_0002972363 /DNA_START=42 /DNA_END=1837 /DNA_ORIENTATION=+
MKDIDQPLDDELTLDDDHPLHGSPKSRSLKDVTWHAMSVGRFRRAARSPRREDLWHAAKAGNARATIAALDFGCDVNLELPPEHPEALEYKSRRCRSQALHAAVRYSSSSSPPRETSDHLEVVRRLLKARADLHGRAICTVSDGGTGGSISRSFAAIHLAAGVGSLSMLQLLLECGADPMEKAYLNEEYHYSPIHDAAFFGRAECVGELLSWDADIEVGNNRGCRATHLACFYGHSEVLIELLDRGAKMQCKDQHGEGPMDAHWKNCRLEAVNVMQVLVENGHYPKVHSVASMLKEDKFTLIAGDLLQATCFELQSEQDSILDFVGVLGCAPRTELERTDETPKPSLRTFFHDKQDILQRLFNGKYGQTRLQKFWDRLSGASRTTAKAYLCTVPGIVCPQVLQALAETPDLGVFKTAIASAIVEEAWSRFWTWHLGDIAGYVIMIALLVEVAIFLRHDGSAPATLVIFVSLLVAKSVFDEVRQLLQGMVFTDWDSSPSSKSAHVKLRCGHRILQYFVEIGNWIDWTCIIMAVSGTHAIATFQGNMYDRGRVGLFCASQWLRLMYSFRALNWCGPRLMPILYAVKDTGAFLAIVLCCIMS